MHDHWNGVAPDTRAPIPVTQLTRIKPRMMCINLYGHKIYMVILTDFYKVQDRVT